MSLSPAIKKAATVALVAAVVGSLYLLVSHYKGKLEDTQKLLQDVTTELTHTRDQYEGFIREQSLIRDVLALGYEAKVTSKEATNEAITKHKREGSRVTVTGPDYSILHQRSREVRENTTGGIQ